MWGKVCSDDQVTLCIRFGLDGFHGLQVLYRDLLWYLLHCPLQKFRIWLRALVSIPEGMVYSRPGLMRCSFCQVISHLQCW